MEGIPLDQQIIKDKELLSLIKQKYKSLSKIDIDEFVEENNETLKEMNSNRNWKEWFRLIKKNIERSK